MRRREKSEAGPASGRHVAASGTRTTFDPAVAAELEALEAALAGEPAAQPELLDLVRDVRAQAPTMSTEFRARLDARVERDLKAAERPKRTFAAARQWLPAAGFAGCLLAGLIAIIVAGGGGGGSNDSAGSTTGAPAVAQRESSGGSDSSAGSSGSNELDDPQTKSVAPDAPTTDTRRVERSTTLELTTTDVQRTADGIVRATQGAGGFVANSSVRTDGNGGHASFVLRVPAAKLDEAIAALSKLGHVRSMDQSANDITGVYDSASARLAEARAERRGLLRALGKASTEQEISSLRARIADNRRTLQRLEREFTSVKRRADYATIQAEVTGRKKPGAAAPKGDDWTPGDAAGDALRVLEVAVGVALIGLAVVVPLALLGAAGGLAAGAWRRRRREAALAG